MDRRVRAVALTAGLVLFGGAAVTWGPGLRYRLRHQGAWEAGDAEATLTPNAKADSRKWEQIEAHFQRGLTMMHAGEHLLAAKAFSEVLKLDEGVVDARVNLGFCFVGMAAWHEAFLEFQTAIAMRPEQANAYYGTALVLYELNDAEGALGNMRTYVHLAGENAPFQQQAMRSILAWEDELRIKRADTEEIP